MFLEFAVLNVNHLVHRNTWIWQLMNLCWYLAWILFLKRIWDNISNKNRRLVRKMPFIDYWAKVGYKNQVLFCMHHICCNYYGPPASLSNISSMNFQHQRQLQGEALSRSSLTPFLILCMFLCVLVYHHFLYIPVSFCEVKENRS